MFNFRRKVHKEADYDGSVEVTQLDDVLSMHLGSDTIQSSMHVKDPFKLMLAYSWGMMCFLLFAPHAKKSVLIGLGGGSIAKYIWRYCPEVNQTVVELNPKVISIARSHFFTPNNDERIEVLEGDGLIYIQENLGSCDVLMMDAFGSHGMPPGFCTQSFFDDCADALRPDGLLQVNLWGSDKNFDIYLQRMQQSFNDRVLVMPTGKPGNIIVFGFKSELPIPSIKEMRARARKVMETHEIDFVDLIDRAQGHNLNNGTTFAIADYD